MSADKFHKVDVERIREAARRLQGIARVTPALPSNYDPQIFYKAESLQITGSFKVRTAYNQMAQLTEEERRRGIVTASSGNFAQGVAFSAQRLGVSAKIVMMKRSNPLKVERTRNWGAEVVFCEDTLSARVAAVAEIARSEGRAAVHPYDHPDAVAGNGTIALETIEQLPQIQNIAVPVSGGGLIGGIALALKALRPEVKILGVQPSGNPTTYLSFKAGEPQAADRVDTVADGLMVTSPGSLTFPLIQSFVDDMVVTREEAILEATKYFLQQERLVVEPSGAVGLAAVMEGKVPRRQTVLILSGGNIAPDLLARLCALEG